MSGLSINGISKNFFKTSTQKTEKTENSNHTNPFGVSFKGNVLTADVFDKKEETNLIERAKNKSKMVMSAAVGSINNFGSAIGARLNSVVSFGNRIKENVAGAWQQANNIEIAFDMVSMKDFLNKPISFGNSYSVTNLQKRPVADLEAMMLAELGGENNNEK